MYKRLVAGHMMYQRKHVASYQRVDMIMMSFICSCRNKIGAELHIYLENLPQGMYESYGTELGTNKQHSISLRTLVRCVP